MEGSETYRVPKLKGSENYESWKEDITSALKVKGLWMITSGSVGEAGEIGNPGSQRHGSSQKGVR